MNLFSNKNIKIPKVAGWLIPGLKVKRWFLIGFLGVTMLVLGFMMASNMRPVCIVIEYIRHLATVVPTSFIGGMLMLIGFGLFFLGWQNANESVLNVD